jgi:hypothetical protein
MKRSIFVLVTVGMLAALGLTSCGALQFGREAGRAAVTPTTLPLQIDTGELRAASEEVEVCGATLGIDEVERRSDARDGEDLVLVTVTVTNVGEVTVPLNQLDFYLFDASGTVHPTAIVNMENLLRSPRLDPGQTATGLLPYYVMAGEAGLILDWSPGWCAERTLFRLE